MADSPIKPCVPHGLNSYTDDAGTVHIPTGARCVAPDPRPAGPDPERDKRIEVYRDRERRRAARALDRYVEMMFGGDLEPVARRTAGERFVEQVGDYVLARLAESSDRDVAFNLHHKSNYGASLVGPLCVHGFVADGQACGEFGCTEPAPHNADSGRAE